MTRCLRTHVIVSECYTNSVGDARFLIWIENKIRNFNHHANGPQMDYEYLIELGAPIK